MLPTWLRALTLLVLAGAVLAPGLVAGPSLDPAVFVHVASEVRDGEQLYVDTWDHKPPGIYLLYAAAQALLPFLDTWLVVWLLSVAATAATALLVEAAARRLGVAPTLAFSAAIFSIVAGGQYLLALGGGLTEPVASLALAGALVLALRPRGNLTQGATGALCGIASLIAIPVLPGALAVVGLAVARHGWRSTPAIAIGAALPLGLTGAWLMAAGAMPAAVDAVIGYSGAYRLTNAARGWELSRPVVTWTVLALMFLIGPALLGAVAGLRGSAERRRIVVTAAGWIGLSILVIAYQGRFFAHYAIPLVIPLAILASFGFERIAGLHTRLLGSMARNALLYAPGALVLVVSAAAAVAGGRMEYLPVARDAERAERVAAAAQGPTTADEPIWVWGNEPQLYLAANRGSATEYSYLYPLVTPGYTTEEMVSDAAADLAGTLPAMVVDAG